MLKPAAYYTLILSGAILASGLVSLLTAWLMLAVLLGLS